MHGAVERVLKAASCLRCGLYRKKWRKYYSAEYLLYSLSLILAGAWVFAWEAVLFT